ncbi:MAG: PH domain-containing protein [Phycisphaerales bacterium]|nr:PH domain-containing protein [Phycisphaerales bacterium]
MTRKRPSPADPTASVEALSPSAMPRALPAPFEVLSEGEVIQLSLKPSMWRILLTSFPTLGGLALVGAAASYLMSPGAALTALVNILALVGAAQLGIASLSWASQLFVLTNRRVLRFGGVTRVSVQQLRLVEIADARLSRDSGQHLLRLGTIEMPSIGEAKPAVIWDHLGRPTYFRDLLLKAIRKAQAGEF